MLLLRIVILKKFKIDIKKFKIDINKINNKKNWYSEIWYRD